MSLPECKTKIVCTIGPACESAAMIEKLTLAGMNVARLNFSHGEFAWHGRVISRVREIARRTGRRVAVMADLPGPKIRIGRITREPAVLKSGATFTLTTRGMTGDAGRVTVNFPALPKVVKTGDAVFLNDGLIELEVVEVTASEVRCRVRAGGELLSGKGLNLPGVDLGIGAFTKRDRQCLEFALKEGVDAVSQSFAGSAADVEAVRLAAADLGHRPFIIAKIERAGALDRYDEILAAADGIMVARGDLGVEVPIERIAVVQKDLIARAIARGKPVITATQMLESMTTSRRPTRAEATDVANAVFDGTDAVMLSAETAVGSHPVGSVAMLARIAAYAESHRKQGASVAGREKKEGQETIGPEDLIAGSVRHTLERMHPAAVVTPTVSGATARRIARFRLPAWIIAVSPSEETCRHLMLSYGVHPVHEPRHPGDWNYWVRTWAEANGLDGATAILTEGPSEKNPDANHRMEIIDLA